MPPSPLLRRAPRRHARDRVWSGLLLLTFVLVATAAGSAPLVVEAAQNASVGRVLTAAEDAGAARQRAVVRITGGPEAPVGETRPATVLGEVPGLGPHRVLGISFGDELLSPGEQWRSIVVPVDGGEPVDRRLAGVDDPTAVLVPTGAAPVEGDVWLDEEAAASAGVVAGDEVRVRVRVRDTARSVTLTVAGVYALSPDQPRPADVPGASFWQDLVGRLPQSTGFGEVDPPLVTDVETLTRVAEPLGEQVLWSVEADLDPVLPRLPELAGTADAVAGLPRQLPPRPDVEGALGRYHVVSGIPALREQSASIAATAVARTRGVAWSTLVLALLAVLVIALVDDVRRQHERRLESAMGLHPLQVGALRSLEVLPAAALGGAVGVGVAWAGVQAWGPDGVTTPLGLTAGAVDAGTAVLGAVALVATATAVSAWLTERLTVLTGVTAARREPPWRTVLVAAAVVTTVGVLSTGQAGGGLEVATPLLVAGACGAVVAGLVRVLLRRALQSRAAAAAGRSGSPEPLHPRRAATSLALRRLVAPGAGQDATVVLLTAGLTLAGFVAMADRSLVASVESKSAVLAGAASVIELPTGAVVALAPDAPPRPEGYDGISADLQGRPVDLDLDPPEDVPVPEGDTVVWLERATVDGTRQVRMFVLDTDTATEALEFGEGSGALVEAREALDDLREVARERRPGDGPDPLPPVLVAGDPLGVPVGETVELAGSFGLIGVEVVGHVPVFPGQGSVPTMIIADTDTYLAAQQADDPRYVDGRRLSGLTIEAEYWSSRSAGEVAAQVRATGLEVEEVRTYRTQALQPAFVAADLVQAYQLVLACLLVLIGVVGLSVRAVRAVDRAMPAAVVLRRTRIGRSGVRRAQVLEQAGLVTVAVLASLLALALLLPLTPALVDPDPDLRPGLDVSAWPRALATLTLLATAAVALTTATLVTATRLRSTREEVVLRDDR